MLALSASVLFHIPLVRELALWTRCVDARKAVALRALQRRRSLMVIPGGAAVRDNDGRGWWAQPAQLKGKPKEKGAKNSDIYNL